MPIKIKEEIERECCASQDLKPYRGHISKFGLKGLNPSTSAEYTRRYKPRFCVHCGQVWVESKEMGPAGGMEPILNPIGIV